MNSSTEESPTKSNSFKIIDDFNDDMGQYAPNDDPFDSHKQDIYSTFEQLYGSTRKPGAYDSEGEGGRDDDIFRALEMDKHFQDFVDQQQLRKDTVSDIQGVDDIQAVEKIYDFIPDFYEVEPSEKKDRKKGTATFKNLADIAREGEGEGDYEGEHGDDFYINPMSHVDSDQKEYGSKREKGFSISDIPKINMDKVINRNEGYRINQDFKNVSNSYDPDNSKDLHDERHDKADSDILSMTKSLDFNSYRGFVPKSKHDVNTNRDSDISWNQKSKMDYEDDEMILNPTLLYTMKTQDMMKDLMDLDSNLLNTDRESQIHSELKEQIKSTKDKIYRLIEDYKENTQKLDINIEILDRKLEALDCVQQELSSLNQDFKQHSLSVEQKLSPIDEARLESLDALNISLRNLKDLEDQYSHYLQAMSEKKADFNHYLSKFHDISSQMMAKMNMCVEQSNSMAISLSQTQEKIESIEPNLAASSAALDLVYNSNNKFILSQVTTSPSVAPLIDVYKNEEDEGEMSILIDELTAMANKEKQLEAQLEKVVDEHQVLRDEYRLKFSIFSCFHISVLLNQVDSIVEYLMFVNLVLDHLAIHANKKKVQDVQDQIDRNKYKFEELKQWERNYEKEVEKVRYMAQMIKDMCKGLVGDEALVKARVRSLCDKYLSTSQVVTHDVYDVLVENIISQINNQSKQNHQATLSKLSSTLSQKQQMLMAVPPAASQVSSSSHTQTLLLAVLGILILIVVLKSMQS